MCSIAKGGAVCNVATGRCVACLATGDCQKGESCTGAHRLRADVRAADADLHGGRSGVPAGHEHGRLRVECSPTKKPNLHTAGRAKPV